MTLLSLLLLSWLTSLHTMMHGRGEAGVFFTLGIICYVVLRADLAIKSKQNGVESTAQYIKLHSRPLFVRVVIAYVTFFGITPSDGFNIPGVTEWAISFFAGLGIDALLDKVCQKIPWLKVVLPAPNGNGAPKPGEVVA